MGGYPRVGIRYEDGVTVETDTCHRLCMTDKIILTPPYPGNKRGSLWTDVKVSQREWVADFEFRVTGPEHGGGNLQLWYTKEGRPGIGTSSVYTVEKFEGLVLVIDMYGGQAGSIRGFLNDGTTDFKNHHHLESLAFGHCDYSYRNLGRPSKLQLKQDSSGFEVNVDGNPCFRSDKVLLPSENYFGITAASSDTPDSFEIYKFILSTTATYTREEPRRVPAPPAPQQQQQQQQEQAPDIIQDAPPLTEQVLNAPSAPQQQSSADFTALQQQLNSASASLSTMSSTLISRLDSLSALVATAERQRVLDGRLAALENQLGELKQTIALAGKDTGGKFEEMHAKIGERHDALLEGLQERVGHLLSAGGKKRGWGFLMLMVVIVQVGGLAGYWYYRKRRDGSVKKYL
ncbi:hypothetical protein MMC17_006137 [Xylographa soralifera]|nr:hypothetical protein [Xylographa soralifera]